MKWLFFPFKTIIRVLGAVLLLVSAVVMHVGTLKAQTVNWIPIGSPAARASTSMAYDGATYSTVLFGGDSNSHENLGDTWIWRAGWFPASPTTSPSARDGAGMAYDGAARNIVLFGGVYGTPGTYLNDTWTWDGINWTQQFPPVSPSARASNMAYDPATNTVVLFGGSNSAGGLGDTWTWDGVAKTWTQQNPSTSPSARQSALAYDAATKTMVLFGGSNGNAVYGDTWTWNGTTWAQRFPTSAPSPRSGSAMTYDPDLGLIVLFGGAVGGNWQNSTNDTWVWNGITWNQIYPAAVPPNRYAFGMDYDSTNKAILMFGGYSTGPARGDTWLLTLAP